MVRNFFIPSISYGAIDTGLPRPHGLDILERYRWITRKEQIYSYFGSPKNLQECGYTINKPAYLSEVFEDFSRSTLFQTSNKTFT